MIRELENENEIIRRCQEGDLRAYEIIYRHFEQPMLRIALRMLHTHEDAQDAVQVTFIKLYQGLRNYRFDSKFSTYLFRIVTNVCLDMIRARKNQKSMELLTSEPAYRPDDDLRLQIEEAIATLPERMRACFVLFAIEELKQADIAKIMGLSVGAVKAQIYHAKARLRTFLSDTNTGVAI